MIKLPQLACLNLIKEEDDIEVEFSIESDNWETYDKEISLRSNTLCLELDVNTEIFNTEQKMQSEFGLLVKSVLRSNGKSKIESVSARLELGIVAQQSVQVKPVSGTSGVGPTTFQQDQSANMKSNNENEGNVSTIPQESGESAQQSAHVEPVSGTSEEGSTTFQQDQSTNMKPMKSNNENEGDVSTIPQESDESAQQSAQGELVSGTSGVGYKRLPPTTSQQDQSAKKKPQKPNNENEGHAWTIPQESDESENIMVWTRICENEDETRLALDDVQKRSCDETLCSQYQNRPMMEVIGENNQILQKIPQQLQELTEIVRNLKTTETNLTKDNQAGVMTSCSPESSSNNMSTGNDQRGQGYQSSIDTDAEPYISSVNNDLENKTDTHQLQYEPNIFFTTE